jgi:diketogulonate reductase-like aldo/keto reductase
MGLHTIANRFGTFFALDNELITRGYGGLKSEVPHLTAAIEAGCKFLDGAFAYGNGKQIAEALAGKKVEQFVLSSKIPGFKLDINNLAASTEKCFNVILESMGVKSIDIMYLHGPDCFHKEVFDTLVNLKEEKRFKYLGVCNVDVSTLDALRKQGYPIAVVQNEFNPYYWEEDLLKYCNDNGIVFVGYRSFGDKKFKEIFDESAIKEVARRVNSTAPAVILQWMYQHGVTSIPHSNDPERVKENAKLPDWKLTEFEMKIIDAIKRGKESTCGWASKLDKPLKEKSDKWIAELVGNKN